MTAVVLTSPFASAVLDALRTIPNPAGGTVKVGDGVKPEGPSKPPRTFYPYGVADFSTVAIEGSLVEPKEDGVQRVHFTAVGLDRAGAEWLRDEAKTLLLDPSSLAIDGYSVVWTAHVTSPQSFRDDETDPQLFNAVTQIDIKVTPDSTS